MMVALFYPFDADFMVRALIAATVIGVCAPLIGTFVVQRRLSLVGDGIGHVAAAGAGIALWLNLAPQPVALIGTLIAACAIEWIFHASRSSDTALAIIFYSGIAASIAFAGRSSKQAQLQQYLFGSILTATNKDVIVISCVCVFVALVVVVFWRQFLAIAVDESSARINGVHVHFLHIILMCSVAFIVSLSMTITGVLLISAVMVIPVLTARIFAHSFLHAWIFSCIVGGLGSVLGLALSRMIDLAPGGTIVLTHVGIFSIVSLFYAIKSRTSS